MNVYVAYSAYNKGEDFTIFNVETSKERAMRHFKEVDVADLVSICPDDLHCMQLEKVQMSREEYDEFCKLVEKEQTTYHGELHEIMMQIFNETHKGWCETLLTSDVHYVFQEIVRIYCSQHGLDAECDNDVEDAMEEIIGNHELIQQMLKTHFRYCKDNRIPVYITYDRYEHDEWYYVYHIDTDENSALEHFKEVDVYDFLLYGPDDCHAFQLQKVWMTKNDYKKLCKLNEANDTAGLEKMLYQCYHEIYDCETLNFTTGDELYEVIKYYSNKMGYEEEYGDAESAYEAAQAVLWDNDALFDEILKEYIEISY